MLRVFSARCHYGVCSDIVDCQSLDIKIYRHLVRTGTFWLFSLLVMSGTRTQKNCWLNHSGRQLSTIFAGGVSMSSLKGNRVENSPQQKQIKNPPAGSGERGWIRNSLELARLRFNFWLKIWRKGGEVVKVGIVLPLFLILKINLSAREINFENPPSGGGARVWIRNSPDSVCLRFHFWTRNRGKGGKVQPKWVLFFH